MAQISNVPHEAGPRFLEVAAALALAAGIGYWAPRVFAPSASLPAATFHSGQPDTAATDHIAGWFGGPALKAHVQIKGLLASNGPRAAALLAVNGKAAQAYRAGDEISPGVILRHISAQGIVLEHDGTLENIKAQALPGQISNGFIRVPEHASPAN